MTYNYTNKCSTIQADPFLSFVEFCPFENACDLLAYGSNESFSVCLITFQINSKSSIALDDYEVVRKSEKLITFDFKGK